jgi:hypothetical protein
MDEEISKVTLPKPLEELENVMKQQAVPSTNKTSKRSAQPGLPDRVQEWMRLRGKHHKIVENPAVHPIQTESKMKVEVQQEGYVMGNVKTPTAGPNDPIIPCIISTHVLQRPGIVKLMEDQYRLMIIERPGLMADGVRIDADLTLDAATGVVLYPLHLLALDYSKNLVRDLYKCFAKKYQRLFVILEIDSSLNG